MGVGNGHVTRSLRANPYGHLARARVRRSLVARVLGGRCGSERGIRYGVMNIPCVALCEAARIPCGAGQCMSMVR